MEFENVRSIGRGGLLTKIADRLFSYKKKPRVNGSKVFHGVKTGDLLAVQGTNGRGETFVVFAVDLGDKVVAFPESTWDNMGVLPTWLDDAVWRNRHPLKAGAKDALDRVRTAIAA